jgi:hypothetical protein
MCCVDRLRPPSENGHSRLHTMSGRLSPKTDTGPLLYQWHAPASCQEAAALGHLNAVMAIVSVSAISTTPSIR